MYPNAPYRRLVHTRAHRGFVAMPCPSTQRPASPCTRAARRIFSRRPLGGALQFGYPIRVWQAEEAVANLPLRLAVRVRCGHPSLAGEQ